MKKTLPTIILLLINSIIFAQSEDFVMPRSFIIWQKKELKEKTRTPYDLPYQQVNRTISITAHIPVLGKDTLLSKNVLNNKINEVNKFFEPTGIQFTICNFQYNHGFEWDTISQFPPTENFNELRKKYYIPGTINMYFSKALVADDGSLIGGMAPLPGYDTVYINPPSPDLRMTDTTRTDWVLIATGSVRNKVSEKTIAHELGHFFGLLHPHETFFGVELAEDRTNCATTGDLICDTPAEPSLLEYVNEKTCLYTGNTQSPIPVDATGTPYMPSVVNLMSYSPETCKTGFSQEQFVRMIRIYYHFRTYLR